MNRSNPKALKTASLFLLATFATAEPLAAFAKNCEGTGANFSSNLQARKGSKGDGKSQVCDQKCLGEIDKNFKNLEKKLEACKDVNKSLMAKKGGQGINIDVYVNNVKERLQTAKDAHRQYVEDAEKICQSVDMEKEQLDRESAAVKNMPKDGKNAQNTWWEKEAQMHQGGKKRSELLRSQTDAAQDRLNKRMGKNNAASGDEQMRKYTENLEKAIQDQVKRVRSQANQSLKARQQSSNAGMGMDDSSAPIRIKRGQEETLGNNLSRCESAIRDVKAFDKKYDQLSRDLAVAQGETRDASQALENRAKNFGDMEKRANDELKKLGGGSAAGAAGGPTATSPSAGTGRNDSSVVKDMNGREVTKGYYQKVPGGQTQTKNGVVYEEYRHRYSGAQYFLPQ